MTFPLTVQCPTCEQSFRYQPSPAALAGLNSNEQLSAMPLVIIDCPHCFQKLSCDGEAGTARVFENGADKQRPVFDTGFVAVVLERVEELNHYGTVCADAGRFAEAEKHFLAALELSRFHPLTWYQFGMAHVRAGNLPEAESSFRNALRSDPLLLQAWNNLGSVLVMQTRYDEADECFNHGIAADPGHARFYLGKANIALQRGDADSARSYLRTALARDPGYSLAQQLLERIDSRQ
jgi:tetratricopeptide (TPR) repeat protein